jgi:hypothetical protein
VRRTTTGLVTVLLLATVTVATARRPHKSKKSKSVVPAPTVTVPASAPAPVKAAPSPAVSNPTQPVLSLPHQLPPNETRCAECHTTSSWNDVRFAHERTGFPLNGAHRQVMCTRCHPSGFAKAVPDRCAGCHRDVHAQEFGMHCEGCHDEVSWRTNFTADAHRRTNFPLTGRHALIPCVECHPNVRDRSFARGAVECGACHLANYQSTAMTSLDHAAAGFPMSCQQCHLPWRWAPASFPQHDQCFTISHGPHSGIRCLSCHTSITGLQLTGRCATGTAACTMCHEHQCTRTDAIHQSVPGYQCKDRKCFECHRF